MESPAPEHVAKRRLSRKISFQEEYCTVEDRCDENRVSCAESMISAASANDSGYSGLYSLSPATEEDCRRALKIWGRKRLLLCSSKIKEIEFRHISQRKAFQYSLDTYVETRNVHSAVEPLENLKNACRQFPQSLWDIECKPGRLFESSEQRVEIPGTAKVILCAACHGKGWQLCTACHGRGRSDCECYADFTATHRVEFPSQAVYGRHACQECNETGESTCPYCSGSGHLHCQACLGKGKLQRYMQLTVRFDSITSSQLMCDQLDLLESRLSKVTGVLVHETDSAEGLALSQFSRQVRQLSQAMLDYHAEQAKRTEARILRQRQTLHAVPVTQVDYSLRGHGGTLWIYGNERRCFCPQLSQSTCSAL